DRLPPVAVVAVPGDGFRKAVGKRAERRPAERAQTGGVERVTAVVPGSVLHVPGERLVGARQLEDASGEVAVLDLFAAPDVVDAAGLAFAQDELDPRAVVLDVEPVASLTAVAVNRERLAPEGVGDEERDDVLGI